MNAEASLRIHLFIKWIHAVRHHSIRICYIQLSHAHTYTRTHSLLYLERRVASERKEIRCECDEYVWTTCSPWNAFAANWINWFHFFCYRNSTPTMTSINHQSEHSWVLHTIYMRFSTLSRQCLLANAHILHPTTERRPKKARTPHFHCPQKHTIVSQEKSMRANSDWEPEGNQNKNQLPIYSMNELIFIAFCVWNRLLKWKKLNFSSSPMRFFVKNSHQTCTTKSNTRRNSTTKIKRRWKQQARDTNTPNDSMKRNASSSSSSSRFNVLAKWTASDADKGKTIIANMYSNNQNINIVAFSRRRRRHWRRCERLEQKINFF